MTLNNILFLILSYLTIVLFYLFLLKFNKIKKNWNFYIPLFYGQLIICIFILLFILKL